jgi:hypothetical protein
VTCNCPKCRAQGPISDDEIAVLMHHYGDQSLSIDDRTSGHSPPSNRCSYAGMVYAAAVEILRLRGEKADSQNRDV